MTGKQKPKTRIEREENEDLEVDEGLPAIRHVKGRGRAGRDS